MVSLLAKWLIQNSGDLSDPRVRRRYGMLCSTVGIILNIILFGTKYFAGVLTGSISITADAFNNLSDAGSSIITLVGFRFAGAKADREHPFGHGRIEYISGFAVSLGIILVGFELAKSSVTKIFHPQDVDTSLIAIVILGVSILVKLYMYAYNRHIGKKINSEGMRATASDSFNDMITTGVVLLSTLVMKFTGLQIDGWCGAAISLFILYAGVRAAGKTLSPLLGQAPDPELVHQIEKIVLSHGEILGIHDLVIHDYGPGRVMISLHGEVDGRDNIYEIHNVIDNIETELMEKTGCEAVIHMDPIDCVTPLVGETRKEVAAMLPTVGKELTMHDFRMVPGPDHTNLIFDVVVPPQFFLSDDELRKKLSEAVREKHPNYFCRIKIDRGYTVR